MGCKLKIYQNWKIQSVENGEDELQIKMYQNWKIQSVENGEDELQIKHLSNWKISKCGKWWRWVAN